MSIPWTAHVITLFPEVFPGVLGASLIGKALEEQIWKLHLVNLKDFSQDRYGHVDAPPCGGGGGMVIRPDVVSCALDSLGDLHDGKGAPIFYLSPRGKLVNQKLAEDMVAQPDVVFLCGRYEGVDQRVLNSYGIQEISICDSILAGGEVAAMAVIEACVRLLPGVLGNPASAQSDTFSNILIEHDQYTMPKNWNDQAIPDVLLTGDHVKAKAFQNLIAKNLTRTRRPDLWAQYVAKSLSET
ncbi:MAG: tRNA (guanosine(37)-N1)-methyltransferase TrmD [Holosporales bacterium]|jgi:tRNA (guanine37-N1)-methyltransferase|nr:tRNA (guanosine(37)-N1)-methyltransferase TrmD [Holosporales bacterium]